MTVPPQTAAPALSEPAPSPLPAAEERFFSRRMGWLRRRIGHFVPDPVWYNWRWDVVAGLCAGVYQGCVWTFALQLARGKLHATGFQIGLAMAAPAIGYLFSTLWARQMEGRSKLPFVTITWFIARGAYMLAPLLIRGPYSRDIFVALICFTPLLFSVSSPAYAAIMKDIYPDALRGRLMSYVRAGLVASMLLTAWIMGFWQEHGGLDFRWMFAIGGVFGVCTAFAFSRLRLPPPSNDTLPPVGAFVRDTFRILIVNPGYRWFVVSVFITGFGNIVANTLYPIYQVDRFHITPTQIATMQNITNIIALTCLFFWGWYMDRFGSLAAVLLVVFINCLAPVMYAVGPRVEYLYVAAAVSGIAMSGVEIGYLNTTLLFAEEGRAAQYQALHSTFFGIRGTIAPLMAVHLLAAVGNNWARMFWLCVGIMIVGVLSQYISLRSYRQEQKLSKRDNSMAL